MFSSNKPTEKVTEQVTEHVPSKSPLKTIAIVAGSLFALSHIGLLGYVLRPQEPEVQQPPTFNLPRGPYSSYKIQAGKDGYTIEYRANDPKVLESTKSLTLDKEKRGFFGGGTEQRTEYRRDQFTMDGTRNLGGVNTSEGKSNAKTAECIAADAGARSQGAMAGSALAAGLAVPAATSIPYVGWLAGGWALLLGQNIGSSVGSIAGSVFNDC
tara:strand:- start:112 stop:747 length:636 start_codon:yes stop_codon:yes gene_type:complete